jgi:hypothetical protein
LKILKESQRNTARHLRSVIRQFRNARAFVDMSEKDKVEIRSKIVRAERRRQRHINQLLPRFKAKGEAYLLPLTVIKAALERTADPHLKERDVTAIMSTLIDGNTHLQGAQMDEIHDWGLEPLSRYQENRIMKKAWNTLRFLNQLVERCLDVVSIIEKMKTLGWDELPVADIGKFTELEEKLKKAIANSGIRVNSKALCGALMIDNYTAIEEDLRQFFQEGGFKADERGTYLRNRLINEEFFRLKFKFYLDTEKKVDVTRMQYMTAIFIREFFDEISAFERGLKPKKKAVKRKRNEMETAEDNEVF